LQRLDEERATARLWRANAERERHRAEAALVTNDLAWRRLARIERRTRLARTWRDVACVAAGVAVGIGIGLLAARLIGGVA
jgi:hypothetical protein